MLRNPLALPRLGWRVARCWLTLWQRSRRYRRDRDWPDAVVVGYLGHFDVLLARRLFPHVPVVLDHLVGASDTARDRGVAGGLRQRLLGGLDDAALAAADVVVVDTEEHRRAGARWWCRSAHPASGTPSSRSTGRSGGRPGAGTSCGWCSSGSSRRCKGLR
jgi:hypothetical protein